MKPNSKLLAEYHTHYAKVKREIGERLREFAAVPPEQYFDEMLYCLLTPQSKAVHAEIALAKLKAAGFPELDIDPTPYLRNPAHYIRFHNQKSKRLQEAARMRGWILETLNDPALATAEKREWLVAHVKGIGWKEASHFLRNIGHLDIAIIDRHILKHMLRCRAIAAIPKTPGTRKSYLGLEEAFMALAKEFGFAPQKLDLLFWSFEEGSVRK